MQTPWQTIGAILIMASITVSPIEAANPPRIVPQPQELVPGEGTFELTAKTRIVYDQESLKPVAQYLAALLARATGPAPDVLLGKPAEGDIELSLVDPKLSEEGYALSSSAKGVKISAATPAGVFYGVQTLRQLFPPEIEDRLAPLKKRVVSWTIPAVQIRDLPRFPYRGFMLDSCRHMQSLDFIKRTLDLMALHKLNRFHWHLTEDQGWRIEIKKYPKLTEVGAFRNETTGDGKRYGGFYTQDQIKEIVAYATERYITVIPEIDMPGHMVAALAAYPNLGCTGGPYAVWTRWGIAKDVLCAGNPEVYDFVGGVLDEVLALFPSGVIHIGGDECPRDRWKTCPKCQEKIKTEKLKDEDALQNYFTHWAAKYLEKNGRRLQGWNEIMQGGDLPMSAIVHQWHDEKAGAIAAKSGRDVVYSQTSFMYFDYAWDRVPMAKVYACEPIPAGLSAAEQKHILGLQANLWTERRPTEASCDDFIWPRLAAMAEVGWTAAELRNYDDFLARMRASHYQRLAQTGLGASQDQPVEKLVEALSARGAIEAKKR